MRIDIQAPPLAWANRTILKRPFLQRTAPIYCGASINKNLSGESRQNVVVVGGNQIFVQFVTNFSATDTSVC